MGDSVDYIGYWPLIYKAFIFYSDSSDVNCVVETDVRPRVLLVRSLFMTPKRRTDVTADRLRHVLPFDARNSGWLAGLFASAFADSVVPGFLFLASNKIIPEGYCSLVSGDEAIA